MPLVPQPHRASLSPDKGQGLVAPRFHLFILPSPVSCRKSHFPSRQNPALFCWVSPLHHRDREQLGFPSSSAGKSPLHTHGTPSSHPRVCGMCWTPARGHSPPLGGSQGGSLRRGGAGPRVDIAHCRYSCWSFLGAPSKPTLLCPEEPDSRPRVPETRVTAASFFTQTMETCSQLGGSPVNL